MKYLVVIILCCAAQTAFSACKSSDIEITSVRTRFVDDCRRTPCYVLRGAATLNNKCAEAVGVQVQIVGLDSSGAPVAANEMWPASVQNIAPGAYTFSLDTWLQYDPAIVRFELKVQSVRRW